MYTPIDFEEDYVVGMRLDGNIGQDTILTAMQRLIPEIESKDQFNIYLEVEPETLDVQQVWESLKFAGGENRKYVERIDKLAVVTTKDWLPDLKSVENKLLSVVDEKVFSFEDKDEAVRWVSLPMDD